MGLIQDKRYIRLTLDLAAKARGHSVPNPMVGAVVVRSGRIVGLGFHRTAGQEHAEIVALRQAGKKARGATLYVSLEPCAHRGRTGPCTEAILRSGVARVVAAMVDPNPACRGRGVASLRRNGIRTTVGILKEEAAKLNEVFVTWMKQARPFVTVKVAQSLDGKIATSTGASQWISGPEARRFVQKLRSQVDAILVGVETVLQDNPRLTVRLKSGQGLRVNGRNQKQPVRVILDSKLRTPPSARLFSSKAPVVVATLKGSSRARERRLTQAGAQVLRLPAQSERVRLKALLKQLASREISHLLIEGGSEVIASAFEARIVDRLFCLVAPKIIGGRTAPTAVGGSGIVSLSEALLLKSVSVRPLGKDLLVSAHVSN